MFNRIKKEWKEIRHAEEHMAYVPPNTDDVETNFHEIKKLIERTGSQHRLEGDAWDFTIRQAKHFTYMTVLAILIALLFIFLGLAVLLSSPFEPEGMLALVFIGIGAYTLMARSSTGNYWGLRVNSHTRTLTVFDDNLLRRHFVPIEEIAFDEIEKVWAVERNILGSELTYTWQKIYIAYGNKQRQIFALPCGSLVYINHHVFMTRLMQIIKKAYGLA
jgi:hypothetical protein